MLFKNASSVGSWHVWDTARTNINPLGKYLQPDTSSAEGDLDRVDFLSNGFKPRANAGSVNTSGDTYIFMAFAEMPFKYSTAR